MYTRVVCSSLVSWVIYPITGCGWREEGVRSWGVTDNKGKNSGTYELQIGGQYPPLYTINQNTRVQLNNVIKTVHKYLIILSLSKGHYSFIKSSIMETSFQSLNRDGVFFSNFILLWVSTVYLVVLSGTRYLGYFYRDKRVDKIV